MAENGTAMNAPGPAPAPHEEGAEGGEAPRPTPTDLRGNVWLLVIILAIVGIAWLLSVLGGGAAPEPQKGAQGKPAAAQARQDGPLAQGRPTPRRAPPRQVRREVRPVAPVTIMRVMGGQREYINAAPDLKLALNPPMTYRRHRLFDVTERADDFKIGLVCRLGELAQRYAGKFSVIVTAEMKSAPFVRTSQVDMLLPDERVIVIRRNGDSRAYPVRLLRTCAGVSDRWDDAALFVCWHFYTQAAACFDMAANGTEITWRDAGLVYRGFKLFYDPETSSLWDGYSGRALAGAALGQEVKSLSADVCIWRDWSAVNPTAQVFMPPGAEKALSAPRPTEGESGRETRPKAFVLGVRVGDLTRAYPVLALPGVTSEPLTDMLGGRTVQLRATSPWTADVRAADGPVTHEVMLWFAWKELHPDTDLFVPPDTDTSPAGTPPEQQEANAAEG